MKRIKRFLILIFQDIAIEGPKDLLCIIAATIILSLIILVPWTFLAWVISIIMETSVGEAMAPTMGLIMMALLLIGFFDYLRKQWRRSK